MFAQQWAMKASVRRLARVTAVIGSIWFFFEIFALICGFLDRKSEIEFVGAPLGQFASLRNLVIAGIVMAIGLVAEWSTARKN